MRWDALALVGVLIVAIGVWVLRLHESLGPALRFDDVCFVLLGAIPGAVVGGRLVHVLDYADSYLPRPGTMLDLAHGSASLVGAVIGGALSAAYICRLLGGRDRGLGRCRGACRCCSPSASASSRVMLGGGGQGAADRRATGGRVRVVADRGAPSTLPWRPGRRRPSRAPGPCWASRSCWSAETLLRAQRTRGARASPCSWPWPGGWQVGSVVALTWRDDHLLGPLGRGGGRHGRGPRGRPGGHRASPGAAPDPRLPRHQTVPEGPGPTGTGGRSQDPIGTQPIGMPLSLVIRG